MCYCTYEGRKEGEEGQTMSRKLNGMLQFSGPRRHVDTNKKINAFEESCVAERAVEPADSVNGVKPAVRDGSQACVMSGRSSHPRGAGAAPPSQVTCASEQAAKPPRSTSHAAYVASN